MVTDEQGKKDGPYFTDTHSPGRVMTREQLDYDNAKFPMDSRDQAAPAAPLVLTIACGPATTLDALEAAFLGSKWFPIRSVAGEAVQATVGDVIHATVRCQAGEIRVEQSGTAKGAAARAKAVARFFERIAGGKPVARPNLPDETQR